ncbi:MAG: arsenite methyltransferase [Pseudonocardiaceae bacterium]
MTTTPEVLFVCVHNAGRSQMAAALLDCHAAGRVHVRSAGSIPAEEINPAVHAAMAELGLDLSAEYPKPLTDDVIRAADVVITMGCGDACPVYPGKRYLDWNLPDPAGKSLVEIRPIRDEIDRRVRGLVEQLIPAADGLRELVRERYAAAATMAAAGAPPSCCDSTGHAVEVGEGFGADLYDQAERGELPAEALAASLGCGNPLAVAELRDGETVLDLGCGGGIDVLLSARRVGPTGKAYGLDMTSEMLELAQANAARAGATNVEFLHGTIEAVPLPDASVNVVISNCVINLSTDKRAVFAEAFRVLRPGGRLGISDVAAEDELTAAQRAERGSYVGCIAGALSRREYRDGLSAAGFTEITITSTHPVAQGMHSAIIRATKPATLRRR